MITIKVISQSSGKPLEGKKASLGFSSLLRGITSSEFMNKNGEAHFDADNGEGEVYVGGSSKYKSYLSGRVVVYV